MNYYNQLTYSTSGTIMSKLTTKFISFKASAHQVEEEKLDSILTDVNHQIDVEELLKDKDFHTFQKGLNEVCHDSFYDDFFMLRFI